MMPSEALAEAIAYLSLTDLAPLAQSNRQLSELALAHGSRIIWRFSILQIIGRCERPDILANFVNNETEQIRFPKVTASDILDIALRNCVIDDYLIICDCRGYPAECYAARSLDAVRSAAAVKRVHVHLCCFADIFDFVEALEQFDKRKLTVSTDSYLPPTFFIGQEGGMLSI